MMPGAGNNFNMEEKNPIMVSVILPTYNEAENLKDLLPRISKVFYDSNIKGEIIVVDDNSPDQTAAVAKRTTTKSPVRVHIRKNERGLSTAVIKGLEMAQGEICVIMDADLSHPVEGISNMIEPIVRGRYDATVGSRYINGGGCENWPFIRRLISKGAGFLAVGVTNLSDPTSGFMAIRKNILDGVRLNPIGWKIVLEIIVKTNCRFTEIPIVFFDRKKGESKLNIRSQIDYIRHLLTLYAYKYPIFTQFVKFCLVGTSGLLIDTTILVCLTEFLLLDPRVSAVFAFFAAVSWNYFLNRLWTFNVARNLRISYSYASFVCICLIGLGLRIGIMHLLIEYAGMGQDFRYVLASFLGIVSATIFNFIGSKFVVFSRSSSFKGSSLWVS
jgi:dolichol-phosphate mannosyltransferase